MFLGPWAEIIQITVLVGGSENPAFSINPMWHDIWTKNLKMEWTNYKHPKPVLSIVEWTVFPPLSCLFLCNCEFWFCLPGQVRMLHLDICELSPGQGRPLSDGDGLLHRRERVCSPLPQDAEHVLQGCHGPQLPSTVNQYTELVKTRINHVTVASDIHP